MVGLPALAIRPTPECLVVGQTGIFGQICSGSTLFGRVFRHDVGVIPRCLAKWSRARALVRASASVF